MLQQIKSYAAFKPTEHGVDYIPTTGPLAQVPTNTKKDRQRLVYTRQLIFNFIKNPLFPPPFSTSRFNYSEPEFRALLINLGDITKLTFEINDNTLIN